jgi:two-component system phosphate regulon sensor histidine kinase PhoR
MAYGESPNIQLAVPVRTQRGDIGGALKGVLNSHELTQALKEASPGFSGGACIVDEAGRVVISLERAPRSNEFSRALAKELEPATRIEPVARPDGTPGDALKSVIHGWRVIPSASSRKDVVAFASLRAPSWSSDTRVWAIVLSQDAEEALAPFHRVLTVASIVICLSLALLVITAHVIASRLAQPFSTLEKGIQIVREGDLSHRINIRTSDELERLGESINRMVEAISVRDQVLQDTNRDLLAREKQLLALTQELERRNTEVGQARAMLATEGSRLFSILHSMGDAVVVLDIQGRILLVNPAFVATFELTEGMVVGKALQEVMDKLEPPPQVVNGDPADLFGPSAPQRMERREVVLPGPDERIMQATASPVRDKDNSVMGKVVLFHDVTALRKIDQLKSDFVSTVSHELRTPLTTIREGISLVLDGAAGKINMRQQECLQVAKDDVDRLTRLISNVLDITKIDAGKLELGKLTKLDIHDLLREVVATHQAAARAKNTALEVDLAPRLPPAYASPDAVIQVMTNLLDNAIGFTPPGGKVTVQTVFLPGGAREGHRDDISPEYLEVSVRDTGVGIQHEDLQRLFGRFQQLGNTRDRRTGGTGMGLFITRNLVEAMGGSIRAESEPQQGACFAFTLPVFSDEAVLREMLGSALREARSRQEQRSLIMVKLDRDDPHKVEDLVHLSLKGSEDKTVLLRGRRQIAIVITANRKTAWGIARQVFSGLRDKGVQSRLGVAVYPEDGVSVSDLVSRAMRELNVYPVPDALLGEVESGQKGSSNA